ncbi:MAG TPA: hypothetical protein VGO58_15195, partial [Chitinophagaceae bacterium]|nr:hypothetical protein [Chitinophagaceae bacterium]
MKLTAFIFVLVAGLLIQLACSKTGGIPPPPPPDPCLSVNINLNGAVINPSVAGANDGTIALSASGGSNFTFSLNGGGFQSSALFKNLGAGSYTVMARSSAGCMASLSFIISNPTISCSSINISILTSTTNNIPCEANSAVMTATASGGTGPY